MEGRNAPPPPQPPPAVPAPPPPGRPRAPQQDPDPANLNLLTNELKWLKKRLYSCELKGMELREKAMRHFCTNPQSPLAILLSSSGIPGTSQATSAVSTIDYSAAFTAKTPRALYNEYLLEQIASHLPMPDLRNMRMVCRLWAKEFLRAISSRKPFLVSDDKSDIEGSHALIRKRTAGGVHNNVHISTLILLETPLRSSPVLTSLVFHFGDTISGLKVDDCYPSGEELYRLFDQLPYLESLCLKSTIRRLEDVQEDTAGQSYPVSVLDSFLSVRPPVRQLVLKKLYWEDLKAIKSIIDLPEAFPSLTVLRIDKVWFQTLPKGQAKRKKTWSNLRDLKVTFHPRATRPAGVEFPMRTLADRINFPALRKLSLTNLKTREVRELAKLTKLLKQVRHTIEELDLVERPSRINSSIKTLQEFDIFPSEDGEGFPRLQLLSCDITFLHSVKIFKQSLTPSLVKVNFSMCNDFLYWWKVLNSYTVDLSTINNNVRTASFGSIDSECLQKISEGLFPCLRTLEVADDQIGDAALRTIFTGFKDLENLRVYQGSSSKPKVVKVTDYAITGIPAKQLKKYSPTDPIPDSLKGENWIGRLQKLRQLDLGALTKCIGFTDFSIRWGLATVSSMQVLVMPDKAKVSAAALKSLKGSKLLTCRWRGKNFSLPEKKYPREGADITGMTDSERSETVSRVLSLDF